MLAGACFGDHPVLAHPLREEGLAYGVVYLVGAGVREVFALQIDLCAAEALRQACGKVERSRPADVSGEQVVEFFLEDAVPLRIGVCRFELFKSRDEGFRSEPPSVTPEIALSVRQSLDVPTPVVRSASFPWCCHGASLLPSP
jgi:hypothetical protein